MQDYHNHLTVDGTTYDISNLFLATATANANSFPRKGTDEVVDSSKLRRNHAVTEVSLESSSSFGFYNKSMLKNSSSRSTTPTSRRPTFLRASSSRRKLFKKQSSGKGKSLFGGTTRDRDQKVVVVPSSTVTKATNSTSLRSTRQQPQNSLKQPPSYSSTPTSPRKVDSLKSPPSSWSSAPINGSDSYYTDYPSFGKEPSSFFGCDDTATKMISNPALPSSSSTTSIPNPSPPMIEIEPGIFEPLRGSKETAQAMNDGYLIDVDCMICTKTISFIQDSAYFLCPMCKIVACVPTTSPTTTKGPSSSCHVSSSPSSSSSFPHRGRRNYDDDEVLFLSEDGGSYYHSYSQQSHSLHHSSSTPVQPQPRRWGVGLGFLKYCDEWRLRTIIIKRRPIRTRLVLLLLLLLTTTTTRDNRDKSAQCYF